MHCDLWCEFGQFAWSISYETMSKEFGLLLFNYYYYILIYILHTSGLTLKDHEALRICIVVS
jgi:hypothetical protein